MKHILFVDDEAMVLNGLRRMLRSMRQAWHMDFLESGEQALDWLEKNPCDVIVSDMRMPGMNGVKLLEQIRQRYPYVIRIALSGHSEMEMLLESVQAAHQFLAKPCDAELLKSTIDRACALRKLLEDDRLSTLVSEMDSLPSLPSLYMEIMNEIASPDGTLAKVGEIISKDVGMTAKILQIVNSAFFGLTRHISSPSQAATLLGLDIIRSLVLSVEVFSSFQQDMGELDLDALWQHSSEVGALARQIALMEEQDAKICDHALMAGMLHDVGKLVLMSQLPRDYAKVLALSGQEDRPDWQAEQEIFGCSHMEVGAYLLGIWGLPNSIVEAVAYHQIPSRSVGVNFTPLTAVHVANALLRNGAGNDVVAPEPLDQDYLNQLGLTGRVPDWQEACEQLRKNGA